MTLSAKTKLNVFITIILILVLGFYIGSLFNAPVIGFKGFIFNIARQASLVIGAAIIITAIIKYKSECKMNKMWIYIILGVLAYGSIATLSVSKAYGYMNDYKSEKAKLTVSRSNYDTYYKTYEKLGNVYYLNVVIDDNLHTFMIDKDSYMSIKSSDTVNLTYYENSNVVDSIK